MTIEKKKNKGKREEERAKVGREGKKRKGRDERREEKEGRRGNKRGE